MTHQLQVPFGALGAVASRIHRHHISRFQELWIPDDRASSLSGKLSSGSEALGLPVQFIGHPSRFGQSQEKGDGSVLILLSGPEPRRSSLEKDYWHRPRKCVNRPSLWCAEHKRPYWLLPLKIFVFSIGPPAHNSKNCCAPARWSLPGPASPPFGPLPCAKTPCCHSHSRAGGTSLPRKNAFRGRMDSVCP